MQQPSKSVRDDWQAADDEITLPFRIVCERKEARKSSEGEEREDDGARSIRRSSLEPRE
jgi:hypothetical protein